MKYSELLSPRFSFKIMAKKVNCCVPNCLNNFRNNQCLQYYRIPKDPTIRKEYVRLLRNDSLKLESDNTRICSQHFEGGKKRDREHLPSLFPWTTEKLRRRELKRVNFDQVYESRKKSRVEHSSEDRADRDQLIRDEQILCSKDQSIKTPYSDVGSQTEAFSEKNKVDFGTQTEAFPEEPQVNSYEDKICKMEAEIQKLTIELAAVKRKLENHVRFDIERFKEKPQDIAFFTGFSDYETLMLCFDIVKEPARNLSYGSHQRKIVDSPAPNKHGRPRKLSNFQEFIMVVMKLRLGLFNRDLAYRFNISSSVVSEIFRTWIRFLRSELEVLIQLPPRDVIQVHMPSLFKEFYPRTAIIIDCTEIEMERPSALNNQSACYSSYKSRTTMKALVGITPSGATAFVSKLYPGSISDKEITMKSGLLNHLQQGDEVMADKGFLIQDELASVGAVLTIPAFLGGRKQFSKEDAAKNKKVACLRVHVERCMERIKNWHILDSKIPISLAPFASDIFIVISALTNSQPPLIS